MRKQQLRLKKTGEFYKSRLSGVAFLTGSWGPPSLSHWPVLSIPRQKEGGGVGGGFVSSAATPAPSAPLPPPPPPTDWHGPCQDQARTPPLCAKKGLAKLARAGCGGGGACKIHSNIGSWPMQKATCFVNLQIRLENFESLTDSLTWRCKMMQADSQCQREFRRFRQAEDNSPVGPSCIRSQNIQGLCNGRPSFPPTLPFPGGEGYKLTFRKLWTIKPDIQALCREQ